MKLKVDRGSTSTPQGNQLSDGDFEYEEVSAKELKPVISIVGDKGTGKTALAFSHPGDIYCFSFDQKSASIKEGMYKGDERIHVVDALKYWSEEKTKYMDSSVKSFEYVTYCLKELAASGKNVDWIVFDGLKIYSQFAEQRMRKEFGFEPYKPFGKENYAPWRRRNQMMRKHLRMAQEIANKGVIYTMYFYLNEIRLSDGSINTEKVPSYSSVVMMETDIVLFTSSTRVKGKRHFLIECDSSKRPGLIETGMLLDVTGKDFKYGVDELKKLETKEVD